MLIFVENREEAESVKEKLATNYADQIDSFTSFNTASSRVQILHDFKTGKLPVLIATSLA